MAARYGHFWIAEFLIERAKAFDPPDVETGIIGAEKRLIRATNWDNDTALHEAVRYDHIKVARILLEVDPDHSYSANNANETPLYLASERKNKHMVCEILTNLKSPAYGGPSNRTALHTAVIDRDIEMAKALLENVHLRASVKHADEKGWVPLHYAAKIGERDLTELLLKQDENTAYMRDKNGRTALHIAAYYDHLIIVDMIIECCPDCSELVDNKGRNALHHAVEGDSFFTAQKIMSNLSLSNLFNEKDVEGNTPLHQLASSRCPNTSVTYHRRVDKHAMNKEDQTALDVAYANIKNSDSQETMINLEEIMKQLKYAGARRSQRLPPNSEDKQEKSQQEDKQEESQQLMFSKEAKETHLLVATLIATVSFAAGLTLPGGAIQDGEHQGNPILGQRAFFKAFIVSDTIALVLSASAAFMHLFSPIMKAKWRDQFLSEVAFSFILVAVAAMMVAFATGAYAVLGSSAIGLAVLTTGLSFFLLRIRLTGGFLVTVIVATVRVMLFFLLGHSSATFGLFANLKRALADCHWDQISSFSSLKRALADLKLFLKLYRESTKKVGTEMINARRLERERYKLYKTPDACQTL